MNDSIRNAICDLRNIAKFMETHCVVLESGSRPDFDFPVSRQVVKMVKSINIIEECIESEKTQRMNAEGTESGERNLSAERIQETINWIYDIAVDPSGYGATEFEEDLAEMAYVLEGVASGKVKLTRSTADTYSRTLACLEKIIAKYHRDEGDVPHIAWWLTNQYKKVNGEEIEIKELIKEIKFTCNPENEKMIGFIKQLEKSFNRVEKARFI